MRGEHRGWTAAADEDVPDEPDRHSPGLEDLGAVVVHGGTHEASIEVLGGVLYVNPGSPTLAGEVSVGVLELDDGHPSATIVGL